MNIEIPSWSDTELEFLRIGLSLTVVQAFITAAAFRPAATQPDPVGIARIVNLSWMGHKRVFRALQFSAIVAALLYAAGTAKPYAVGWMALAVLLNLTFVSSQGTVNHGYHLLAIVLAAQAIAYPLWAIADHPVDNLDQLFAPSAEATAAWWSIQAIAAVYLTSGLTKLINSNGLWVRNSPGLLMDALSRHDTWQLLDAQPRRAIDLARRLTGHLLAHVRLAQAMFALGLLIELLAPVGLLGEPALLFIGIALIALHMSNGILLGLSFPLYQLLVLTFYVNPAQLWR